MEIINDATKNGYKLINDLNDAEAGAVAKVIRESGMFIDNNWNRKCYQKNMGLEHLLVVEYPQKDLKLKI